MQLPAIADDVRLALLDTARKLWMVCYVTVGTVVLCAYYLLMAAVGILVLGGVLGLLLIGWRAL